MGFHICEYCEAAGAALSRDQTSSGDVTLAFDGGGIWTMPDMIVHYIEVHHFHPGDDFVDDVLDKGLVVGTDLKHPNHRCGKWCDKFDGDQHKVGYLSGGYVRYDPLACSAHRMRRFLQRLQEHIAQASAAGMRQGTRGIDSDPPKSDLSISMGDGVDVEL